MHKLQHDKAKKRAKEGKKINFQLLKEQETTTTNGTTDVISMNKFYFSRLLRFKKLSVQA